MPTGKRTARGFTYIGILIAVTIIGVALATTGLVWHTKQQRARERELLYIGDQFRLAIGKYVNASSGTRQYPGSLDDLLRDPRQPGVVRYIRKIYFDPITRSQDWGLIKDANDHIMGVFSKSEKHPIKQRNFSQVDKDFADKTSYSDWKFIYLRPKFGQVKTRTPKTTAAPAITRPSVSSGTQ